MSRKIPTFHCIPLLLTWWITSGFTMAGFKTPDTVLADPETGLLYVSNVNGHPAKRDHNGFISLLEPEGRPINMHFIRSGKGEVDLSAPKGMVLIGPHLYVTDLDKVLRFDKTSGRHLGTIDLSSLGGSDLNGLASGPDGALYAADTEGNTIFRIDTARQDQARIFVRDADMGHPTTLVYDTAHRRLLVGTWKSGHLLFIDEQGKIFSLMRKRFGGLKGLGFDGEGNLLFSAFVAGTIYRLKNYETLEVVRQNLVTPASFVLARNGRELLVPSFRGNIVFTVPLPPP